jgi:iron(III) transport system permease protein
MFVLVLDSFMTRMGYFALGFTTDHWQMVLTDSVFIGALGNTLILATTAAIASPLLFSVIAYILVRTRLPGRQVLDVIIWSSGAIPGILSGLGLLWLFLDTPGLSVLFGTIWALIIVVVLHGNTTGVSIMKGVLVQIGADMEEAARASGAGWLRTYFSIWLPLLMPNLILLAVINFVMAAGATSNIILLASRDTMTLSLMALEAVAVGNREEASIIGIFVTVITMVGAIVVRRVGFQFGISHLPARRLGDPAKPLA